MPAADTGPLTVGLLGLGVIGQVHLRTLAALADATVVLAVDPQTGEVDAHGPFDGLTATVKADQLRRDFGESIGRNATHGSDAPDTAAFELGYFFRGMELT